MKKFPLDSNPKTEAFLRQDRRDGVTGEPFFKGEEVVFCAVCKSAFHPESWEYMGGMHCGQSETLKSFPEELLPVKFERRGGEKLYEIFYEPLVPVRESRRSFPLKESLAALLVLALHFITDIPQIWSVVMAVAWMGFSAATFFRFKKQKHRFEVREQGLILKGFDLQALPDVFFRDLKEVIVSYYPERLRKIALVSEQDTLLHPQNDEKGVLLLELVSENEITRRVWIGHMSVPARRHRLYEQLTRTSLREQLVFNTEMLTEGDLDFLYHTAQNKDVSFRLDALSKP